MSRDTAERNILLRDVMDRIGDKWSVTAICRLDGGPLRFNALRRTIDGITQRSLSATLRRLERDGLITRTVHRPCRRASNTPSPPAGGACITSSPSWSTGPKRTSTTFRCAARSTTRCSRRPRSAKWLPPALPPCRDRTAAKVSHPHSVNQRLTAHVPQVPTVRDLQRLGQGAPCSHSVMAAVGRDRSQPGTAGRQEELR